MNMGLIGLGRMGCAIASRVLSAGHTVFGFDPSQEARTKAQALGVNVVATIADLATHTRVFWLMIPAPIVDEVIEQMTEYMKPTDIVIDGGNSKYTDSQRRAQLLERQGIHFLDCGTSGGLHGQQEGFCLMVGGDESTYVQVYPLLEAIATSYGVAHLGPSGAGHYVKMVHNGIEYALLQAYAEGFHVLKEGAFKDLDVQKIAQLWNHGAIIRSWILRLIYDVLVKHKTFAHISGKIGHGKTAQWTIESAQEYAIPVPLIEHALEIREWSAQTGGNYATQLVALLRNEFGGHEVIKKE